MRYLDADTLDQCHQALRDGQTLDALAGKLHLEPATLARLLGLPPQKRSDPEMGCDLWRTDEAERQL